MVLQDCNRYIVVHKDKILGIKGWVKSKNIESNQLRLFKTPDLQFILDDSYDRGQRIEDLIKEIHKNDKTEEIED